MNRLAIICFILILLFSISCTSLKYKIKRNNAFTDEMVAELLENNDNAFNLGTEYSNASFVWTYRESFVQIFKLINGAVSMETKYEVSNGNEWIIQYYKESFVEEIFDCTELDGDLIEIRIKKNGVVKKQSFPVNLECFIYDKYASKFLSRIAEDMKKYDIRLNNE